MVDLTDALHEADRRLAERLEDLREARSRGVLSTRDAADLMVAVLEDHLEAVRAAREELS